MDMEKTGVNDIDNIFDSVVTPLNTLAELNNLLKKGENKIRRRTHAYLLTACTLEDSITALLYAISADTNGDFDKAELKVTSDPPYLKVSKHHVDKQFHEAIDAWNYLVEKLIEATAKLADLPGQINTIVQEASGYSERAKTAIENAGLNAFEAVKAGKAIANNVSKISKATAILDETTKLLAALTKVVSGLTSKLDHEGRQKIHAVGKEINKSKLKDMREIIVQFWPEKTRLDLKLERPRKSKPATHA